MSYYEEMTEEYKEICRQGKGYTWDNYIVWKTENPEAYNQWAEQPKELVQEDA